MGRKKKHEEHENLERWLVSYSDFITLLFATFVVLYALSQSNIDEFSKLEEALKNAFSNTSTVLEGQPSFFEKEASIMEGATAGSEVNPIMLEYLSQKYETSSFEDVKKNVDKMSEEGVGASIEEKGLVIRIDDSAVNFAPNSAQITSESVATLGKIGDLLTKKFKIHIIRVEGHTDSDPTSGRPYPTNWELSGARASAVINFFIRNNGISPKLFIAAGFADTVPLAPNNSLQNKAKNRRVEIVVLKNKYARLEDKDFQTILNEATNRSESKPAATVIKPNENPLNEEDNFQKQRGNYSTELYNKEIDRLNKLEKHTEQARPAFMKGE